MERQVSENGTTTSGNRTGVETGRGKSQSRRLFLKRSGGVTAATVVAWHGLQMKAGTRPIHGDGSSFRMSCTEEHWGTTVMGSVILGDAGDGEKWVLSLLHESNAWRQRVNPDSEDVERFVCERNTLYAVIYPWNIAAVPNPSPIKTAGKAYAEYHLKFPADHPGHPADVCVEEMLMSPSDYAQFTTFECKVVEDKIRAIKLSEVLKEEVGNELMATEADPYLGGFPGGTVMISVKRLRVLPPEKGWGNAGVVEIHAQAQWIANPVGGQHHGWEGRVASGSSNTRWKPHHEGKSWEVLSVFEEEIPPNALNPDA